MTTFKRVVSSCLKLGFCAAFAISLFGPREVEAKQYSYVHQAKKVAEKLHLVVYVDDLFTPEEKLVVAQGLQEWTRATNGMITFETKSGWTKADDMNDVTDRIGVLLGRCTKSVHIARVTPEDSLVKQIETDVDEQINGFAQGKCESKFILLVMGRIEDDVTLAQTTTHEMGHILQLAHIPVANRTVMYPGDTKATLCVTELDLIQLCDLEHFQCDVSKMQPCVPVAKKHE